MSPLVALKEVTGPRKDQIKDRETSNEAKMPPKLFRFTHFPKNASATPLVSHTFKTKDLKPFRFTHFQKKVGVLFDFLPLPAAPCVARTSHESRFPSPCDRSIPSVN